MQVQAVGMSWYKPENFARLRAMFEDGHKLHRTYDEWLTAAETNKKMLEANGTRVFCVDIDPDEFPKWCTAQGLKLDANARNTYASSVAYQMITGSS